MGKYIVKLNDGSNITIEGDIVMEDFVNNINSPNKLFVALGNTAVQKHMILIVAPLDETTTITE